ncbi:hypothetical protein WME97_36995 [Sorangium sp. So ce367]|uniref:hypothetical protein n=1 Tax=Sorangium sp. So ce367 TaxID=3133305 RepID=UPI003F630E7F
MDDAPIRSVGIDAHGLFVDDALVARREEIRSALLLEHGQPGPTLWIHRRFRSPLTVRVMSSQRGHQLLKRLGFDASQSVARFPTPSGGWRFEVLVWLIIIAAGASCGAWFALSALLLFLGLVTLLIRFTGRTRVVVGSDGVLVDKTFVHYEDIMSASTWDNIDDEGHGNHFVGVATRRGGFLTLWQSGGRFDSSAIVDRIHQALEGYRQSDPVERQDELSRNGLTVPAWIARARSLNLAKEGTYRTAHRDETRWLWRAVEDVSAKPEARATAAMALAVRLDDAGRQRLRAVVQAVAWPPLRRALLAIDARHDAALAAALASFTAPPRP